MAVRYRIGEFAHLSGVSIKTLRFYDEIGLLQPASVDSRTRYRYYVAPQLEELASIVALKNLGIRLSDIRSFVSKTGPRRDQREFLTDIKKTVEQSLRTATRSLNWIHAALAELDASKPKPPIPVVVKRRLPIPIVSVRAKVENYAEIVKFEEELLNALPTESVGNTRGVLWHRCADSGSLEGEPFIALKRRLPSRTFYDTKMLPPATLACAYAGLDDESSEDAYDALRKWMNVRGYGLAGPKREIYLDQMLEIQFPMKSE
jgi:DNA-binding transcriptional MerR regulator